jgi:hypothetical protein
VRSESTKFESDDEYENSRETRDGVARPWSVSRMIPFQSFRVPSISDLCRVL